MNSIADLYIRVSTDEQADKGYSQRSQEEVLRRYCENNSIVVNDIIYEDYSAKSFDRPQWKVLIQRLKKKKSAVNLVLFTKWDRFSRNAGDAYQMINLLHKLGVDPQAIEQPLDTSIPENKMMLAFYLAAPEVENDRRALNVFYGMRRAKKEGRYMGKAPIGYINRTRENGSKYIAPLEPYATIFKWACTEIAKGTFNTEQIWKKAKKKGLNTSKNAFWQAIRNPVYCGKIFISQFGDEESHLVPGQHEPIISEALFYKVQEVIDGRCKKFRPKIETTTDFPLRGFLVCPDCGRLLTGSRSKGRTKYYAYYHGGKGCDYRVKAGEVNKAVLKNIQSFIPEITDISVYSKLITGFYKDNSKEGRLKKQKILNQIKEYEDRLSHVRDLLATRKIDVEDYRYLKAEYSKKISILDSKLTILSNEIGNIQGLVHQGVKKVSEIHKTLKMKGLSGIRQDIGSIYPENIGFSKSKVRTVRSNNFIQCIYVINKQIYKNKKGTKVAFSTLSREVAPPGVEPESRV